MKFNDYQHGAQTTAQYPNIGSNYVYTALGIGGEAGEVVDKIKKIVRTGQPITPEQKEAVIRELGDVLWYIAMMAFELGFDLETVAQTNIKKLASRKDRNTIKGEGDNR